MIATEEKEVIEENKQNETGSETEGYSCDLSSTVSFKNESDSHADNHSLTDSNVEKKFLMK